LIDACFRRGSLEAGTHMNMKLRDNAMKKLAAPETFKTALGAKEALPEKKAPLPTTPIQ
jgi:hypothetical protein